MSAGIVTAICLKEYFKRTSYAQNIIQDILKASYRPIRICFCIPISRIIDHASALRPHHCRCLQVGIIAAYQ
jgi:hypothetical protein